MAELRKTMTEEEYDKLDDFIDKYTQQMVIEIEEYFIEGFSIANRLRDESLMK